MKKFFTLLMLLGMLNLGAQTYFSQDFEGGSFPVDMAQTTNATDGGWKVGNNTALSSSFFPIPANGTNFMAGTNDDACNCDKSEDILMTPVIDLTMAVTPYLNYDVFFGGLTYQGSTEIMRILVSVDGGTTWNALTQQPGDATGWVKQNIDVSAYAGMDNVAFAFHYNDGGGWTYGAALDNITVKEPAQIDPDLRTLTMRTGGLTGQSINISGEIGNNGLTNITSVDVTWNDGSGDNTETIDGLNIAPFTTASFTHSVPHTLVQGIGNIQVSISNPNGTTDEDETNNALATDVRGITPAPGRGVVIEEGTGTWCGWCPRGTVLMDAMTAYYPDHFIGIAVHNGDPMNIPGYDSSVGFTGYPTMSNERTEIFSFGTIADIEDRFFQRIQMTPPATLQSAAEYDAATGMLTITSEAVAQQNVSGNYRLAVILTEDGVSGVGNGYAQVNYYSGGGNGPMGGYENLPSPVPASQMVYDHVGRMLIGGFNGVVGSLPTDMVSGERYTWIFDPVSVSPTFNTDNMHVVTLLLNPQGQIINASSQTFDEAVNNAIVGTKEVFAHDLAKVFPNPFSDVTNVRLTLTEATNVEMVVFNAMGQLIAEKNYGQLSGDMILPFDGTNLAEGMYYIHIRLDGQLITKKVNLNR